MILRNCGVLFLLLMLLIGCSEAPEEAVETATVIAEAAPTLEPTPEATSTTEPTAVPKPTITPQPTPIVPAIEVENQKITEEGLVLIR